MENRKFVETNLRPQTTVRVRQLSTVSIDNSYDNTLIANESFRGEWEDILPYATIVVSVLASDTSAADGLEIEFSPDNGDTVVNKYTYSVPASTAKSYIVAPLGRYIRLTYTNGATALTEFNIETIYKPQALQPTEI